MSKNKTQPHDGDVHEFISGVKPDRRRQDALILLELMERISGFKPRMWGDSIVGFGQYHYRYASGREGDFLITGFSPRKSASTIYIMPGFKLYQNLLRKLGKHRHSVSCLYINRLDQVDMEILEEIVKDSIARMKKIYPDWSA